MDDGSEGGGGEIILGVQSGIHDFDFCCCVVAGILMAGEERYGGKRKDSMAGKGKIWREEQLQHHYLAEKRVAKMAGRVFSDLY